MLRDDRRERRGWTMRETTAMQIAGEATDSHGWIMSESLRALGRGGKNAGSW